MIQALGCMGVLVVAFIGALALSPDFHLSGWAIATVFAMGVLIVKAAKQ